VSSEEVTIRLLLADEGSFREVDISVPLASVGSHERLIDLLQEEPSVLKSTYIDLDRLCAARVVAEGEGD
jgi:hypothetical protein